MEAAVGELLLARGWSLGIAEPLTGGLLAARWVAVPGASRWLRGSVVAYAAPVKRDLLGVGDGSWSRNPRPPSSPPAPGASSAPTLSSA